LLCLSPPVKQRGGGHCQNPGSRRLLPRPRYLQQGIDGSPPSLLPVKEAGVGGDLRSVLDDVEGFRKLEFVQHALSLKWLWRCCADKNKIYTRLLIHTVGGDLAS
jgi:hypothetical protein